MPDETGLADGIRAETRRYLASHEWLGHATLAPAVAAAEERALASLREIVATAPQPQPVPSRPVRRLALEPAATIVGNMGLRKRRTDAGVELSWDAAANVVEWAVRISSRPDPRGDYEELAELSLPGSATSLSVALDDDPRRIQLTASHAAAGPCGGSPSARSRAGTAARSGSGRRAPADAQAEASGSSAATALTFPPASNASSDLPSASQAASSTASPRSIGSR